LGQARSWDRPFKILGTSPLLGHARGSVYRVVKENVF
jgi:hypothetical protein